MFCFPPQISQAYNYKAIEVAMLPKFLQISFPGFSAAVSLHGRLAGLL